MVPGQQTEWAEKNATVLYSIVVQAYNELIYEPSTKKMMPTVCKAF